MIQDETVGIAESQYESLEDNLFWSVDFVEHLFEQFLYYCFLWASFGPTLYHTRWNNGCLENGNFKYSINNNKIEPTLIIF